MNASFKTKLNYGLVILLCVITVLPSALAQKEAKENFKRGLEVSNQSPLPFESIGVLALVSNESGERVTEVRSWDTFMYWSDRTEPPLGWTQYVPDHEPMVAPATPKPLTLNPGESRAWARHLDYQSGRGHVLKSPGLNLLRAQIGEVDSEPIQIRIKEPQGIDREAYEFLKGSNLHRCFSERTVRKYLNTFTQDTARQLEEFSTRFAGSRYAQLARLGLALMWMEGVEGKKDLEQAVSLLQSVTSRANDDLAARAYYYLGRIAEEQGGMIDADHHYVQALSLKIDPYFRHQAEQARKEIEKRLSKQNPRE
jgi:tetratricopeptide (TPR) repeat protein